MDSKTEEDPFDLFSPNKIKIKDFLVFKESEDDENNYLIKEVKDSREQNLNILQYIQKIIKSYPDMNSEEVLNYLKQQRIFIKRYLKDINKNSSLD
jgi:hypothetical protein